MWFSHPFAYNLFFFPFLSRCQINKHKSTYISMLNLCIIMHFIIVRRIYKSSWFHLKNFLVLCVSSLLNGYQFQSLEGNRNRLSPQVVTTWLLFIYLFIYFSNTLLLSYVNPICLYMRLIYLFFRHEVYYLNRERNILIYCI